ncbi:methyltransferase domain-containing protein [Candidatus Nitrosotenuis cloacae]|uniref:SAM-dependent methyltransferase n=1 Tax=Candidatus Nitrosotenuis cloacae TaxID=1603555 RepID=A0A3G1B1J2_9ARCH|nr:methyltransferase domain-containing protein [Candidatus Nitrosotenuis cloacae]AJZ75737.1 SAM-dependent methyltransferase [Candidatus Nitrosotenuis cloacae]
MKIEEYISSLPTPIISGQEVELPDDSLREIFRFVDLGKEDVLYHLGCGTGNSLSIATKEFGAKTIGIDNDKNKIIQAEQQKEPNRILRCEDITESDLSDATVILFWFSDENIIQKMLERFSKLKPECRIITIFDPLPGIIPNMVRFPYLLHKTPFTPAKSLKDQVVSIFETECIDFTTAWEYAERYTKAVGSPDVGNDRFLTILQTIMIWINARNLGLSCTKEIPAPVKAYIEILDNFFNIEVKHLIK